MTQAANDMHTSPRRPDLDPRDALGTEIADLAREIRRLDNLPPRQGPAHQAAGYTALEKSLSDIVEHIEISDQSNSQALRAVQVRLAMMSAKAAAAPAADLQGSATALKDMGERAGDLSTRIEQVNQKTGDDAVLQSLEARIAHLASLIPSGGAPASPAQRAYAAPPAEPNAALGQIDRNIQHPGNLAQDPRTNPDAAGEMNRLNAKFADLSDRIDSPPPPARTNAIHVLGQRLDELAQKVDRMIVAPEPAPQITELLNRVTKLDTTLEQMRSSHTGDGAGFEQFEKQLGELSHRLSATESRFDKLQSIENSITQLFDAVQKNHDWATQAVQQAAQQRDEQLRTLQTSPSAPDPGGLDLLQDTLRSVETDAQTRDRQTTETLNKVYDTLDKITGRLATLEQTGGLEDVAGAMEPGQADPPGGALENANTQALAETLAGNMADDQREPIVLEHAAPDAGEPDHPAADQAISNPAPRAQHPNPSLPQSLDGEIADDTATRPLDYIQAARQAARQAQSPAEPQQGARTSRFKPDTKSGKSAGRSRKPLLLAAAVVLALGAVAAYSLIAGKPNKPEIPPANTIVPKPAAPAKSKAIDKPTPARKTKPARQSVVIPPPISPPAGSRKQPAGQIIAAAPATRSADVNAQPVSGATNLQSKPVTTTPSSQVPISSKGPQMGRHYSLLEPTGVWSVLDIVRSVRKNRRQQLTDAQNRPLITGSVARKQMPPSAQHARPVPGSNAEVPAKQAAPGTPKAAVSAPLPPAAIGPIALRAAAASGNPQAQFEIASRYAEGKKLPQDYRKATAWYQKAAAQGLAPAQYRLGTLYEKGRGVPLDKAAARIWYERAAEKGNRKAMHNLAVIYTHDTSGKPDFAKAALWFRKASEIGLTDSQFNLGILSERGLGTPKDLVDAYKWFSIAARNGDKEAVARENVLEKQLSPQLLVKAKLAAQTWEPQPLVRIANEVAGPQGGWGDGEQTSRAPPMSKTQMIAKTQALLNKIGVKAGPPDGILGKRTRNAIRVFQSRHGMTETGDVSNDLIGQLRAISG